MEKIVLNGRPAMKKVVLTGAPYSGKTTVIEALKEQGHPVVPEAAIQVIDVLHRLIPDGVKKWRSEYFESFAWLISQKQRELEEHLEIYSKVKLDRGTIFLDRGSFDNIAFATHFGIDFPEACMELTKKSRYDSVYLLDLVKPFDPRSDTGRIETEEDCHKLQTLLELVYYKEGYKPVGVPFMPVEDRVDFILGKEIDPFSLL